MKNTTIQLPIDGEKLDALRMALEDKDIFLEDEIERLVMNLYRRTVSKSLQAYLDRKAANASKPAASRPAKPKAEGSV